MEKMTLEEKTILLAERFESGIKNGFGAVSVLYSINQRHRASSKEIRKDLKDIFGENLTYSYTSFYRLIGRLRDEFELIKEVERRKAKGPARVYYVLTDLGKSVLKEIFKRYIQPLAKLRLARNHQ